MIRALLAALAVALAVVPAAAGHGGGGKALGYTSTIRAIEPPIPGLEATIRDSDDRILLDDRGAQTVVVLGYENEPYLHFAADGVYRNTRSPATYLNEDRYAQVTLPPQANAKAAPHWVKVSSDRVWEWHDHRIHWMSTLPPPVVRDDPKEPHHIFDWRVPLQAGGTTHRLLGSLDYSPPKGSRLLAYVGAGIGLLGIGAGAVVLVLMRRRTIR